MTIMEESKKGTDALDKNEDDNLLLLKDKEDEDSHSTIEMQNRDEVIVRYNKEGLRQRGSYRPNSTPYPSADVETNS